MTNQEELIEVIMRQVTNAMNMYTAAESPEIREHLKTQIKELINQLPGV